MSRRRPAGGPRPPAGAGERAAASTSPMALEVALILLCVALALWTQRRSLGGFFSLDDLVIMEAVRGLRPEAVGLWRLVSRHLFFGAAVPAFGSNPFPYHLVSWLLHGADVALLYLVARRMTLGPVPAALAAAVFGASRLHFMAIGSAACVGELLALGLTLGALLLHDRGKLGAAAGATLFALAMLSKESVAFLPLIALLPRPGAGRMRERLRLAAPLLAVSAVIGIALVASGAGATHLAGEAYARAFGVNLFLNLMTYTAWASDLVDPLAGQVSVITANAWPAGVVACPVLLLVVVAARRATPLPAFGAAWWLLALLPVLPLLHHTYAYYLYVPLAGLALWLAGAWVWATGALAARGRAGSHGRAPSGTAPRREGLVVAIAAGLAALLVIGHAWWSDRLLAQRVALRMEGTGIPLDPDLRKSELARHAFIGVGERLAGAHGRVGFLLPASLERSYSTATGDTVATAARGAHRYGMLEGALDGGRGLRVLLPSVDSVAFLDGWAPGYGGFELFGENEKGKVFSLGRGADGFALAGALMMDAGVVGPAGMLMEQALSEFPNHAALRFQYARAFHLVGDSVQTRAQLMDLLRRAPNDPLAPRARAMLAGSGARR